MKLEDLKVNQLYIFDDGLNIGIFKYVESNQFILIKDISFSYLNGPKDHIYRAKQTDYQYLRKLTKLDKVKYL